MSGYSNEVTARCHCGAVTLNAKLSAGFSTKRRCDCSFCRRRSAAAVTARLGDVEITKGADRLTLYQWGTDTAKQLLLLGLRNLHVPSAPIESRRAGGESLRNRWTIAAGSRADWLVRRYQSPVGS